MVQPRIPRNNLLRPFSTNQRTQNIYPEFLLQTPIFQNPPPTTSLLSPQLHRKQTQIIHTRARIIRSILRRAGHAWARSESHSEPPTRRKKKKNVETTVRSHFLTPLNRASKVVAAGGNAKHRGLIYSTSTRFSDRQ